MKKTHDDATPRLSLPGRFAAWMTLSPNTSRRGSLRPAALPRQQRPTWRNWPPIRSALPREVLGTTAFRGHISTQTAPRPRLGGVPCSETLTPACGCAYVALVTRARSFKRPCEVPGTCVCGLAGRHGCGILGPRGLGAGGVARPEGPGSLGGSSRKLGGSVRKPGGSSRNLGGSSRNLGGSSRNLGGSFRKLGGSSRKPGGSSRRLGGSSRNLGGSFRNLAGSLRNLYKPFGKGCECHLAGPGARPPDERVDTPVFSSLHGWCKCKRPAMWWGRRYVIATPVRLAPPAPLGLPPRLQGGLESRQAGCQSLHSFLPPQTGGIEGVLASFTRLPNYQLKAGSN